MARKFRAWPPCCWRAASLLRHELTEPGARTSMNLLALSDFEPEFKKWDMVTDIDHPLHHDHKE
ncbi:hypothetical protein LP419_24775 [Massilia sp. H-1]|nr:hypothetical protein LP419_24775 [Massilia sp. H-1]